MPVKAIRPDYHGEMKDTVDKFHGKHTAQAVEFCRVARRVFGRDNILSLSYASRHFDTIEINGTHYSLQRADNFAAHLAIIVLDRDSRMDSSQPLQARTANQAQQDSFRLIIERVPGQDFVEERPFRAG